MGIVRLMLESAVNHLEHHVLPAAGEYETAEENLSSTYQALGVLLHEPQNARLQSWRPQLMVLQTVVRRLT